MSFTQLIELTSVDNEAALRDHIATWDRQDAAAAPGYQGSRLLRREGATGSYVLAVDFSSAEEAAQNNDRPETSRWAKELEDLGTATYVDLTEVYRTSS